MPHVNELHAQHDPILIVSLASGDLAAADRDSATATSLVETCVDCSRLHDDVLALARATKALPPAVRRVDFRISPEQAAKLRPAGWRRFIPAPGVLFNRQLGVGLSTLGIAGLLLTALPAVPIGMGGAAAPSSAPGAVNQELAATDDGSEAAAPAAPAASMAASSTEPYNVSSSGGKLSPIETHGDTSANQVTPPPSRNVQGLIDATATPELDNERPAPEFIAPVTGGPTETGSSGGPSGLAIASTVLLLVGLLLLVGRRLYRGASSA